MASSAYGIDLGTSNIKIWKGRSECVLPEEHDCH